MAFLTQNKDKLCNILITTLFFLEKRQCFAEIVENRKNVIITSTLVFGSDN
jgi:hypothetical protein